MRRRIAIIIVFCMLIGNLSNALFVSADDSFSIYVIGDSTAASYTVNYAPLTGWAQKLGEFLPSTVKVKNYAVSGESSKSFIERGLFSGVENNIQPGDYLIIQFGHNDSAVGDANRYTEPHTTYKDYLMQYVNKARQKGATPILATSIERRLFSKGKATATLGEYPNAMRELAVQENITLIDLNYLSLRLYNHLGEEGSKQLFNILQPGESPNYPNGSNDNTHLRDYGAGEIAKLFLSELAKTDLPIAYLGDGVISPLPENIEDGNSENKATKILIYEDFENDDLPVNFIYNNGFGKIKIDKTGGGGKLFLDHDYDGAPMSATAKFNRIFDDVLTSEIIVMQPNKKVNGEVFFAMNGGLQPIFSIESHMGNISVKTKDGLYVTIVENYFYNKWYKLTVETDIVNKINSFYFEDLLIAEDVDFLSEVSFADGVCFQANMSPGFMVDSVKVESITHFGAFSVNGGGSQAIHPNESIKYRYSAVLLNTEGKEINDEEIVWSLAEAAEGVSIQAQAHTSKADLIITPEAAAGTVVEIIAKVKSSIDVIASITVTLEQATADKIVISGDSHLSVNNGQTKQIAYRAAVYDTLGNEIKGEKIIWSLLNETGADISLNSNTGTLTLSGAMPDEEGFAYLTATLFDGEGVTQTKKLLVQPFDLYFSDMQRLNAVINGVDTLLKYAGNREGANPLMSAFISPYMNTHGYWNLDVTGPCAVSNASEQFELFRAMTGLTNLTGDEKYEQRVKDIYQWYIDHARTPSDTFYWGNHLWLDLETGKVCDYYIKGPGKSNPILEVEDRDTYFEPLIELDVETVIRYCKNYFISIITDFTTYDFNRHAPVNVSIRPEKWE